MRYVPLCFYLFDVSCCLMRCYVSFRICSLFLAYSPCAEMLSTFVATCSYHPPLSLSCALWLIPSPILPLFWYKSTWLSAGQVLTILSYNRTQGRNISNRLTICVDLRALWAQTTSVNQFKVKHLKTPNSCQTTNLIRLTGEPHWSSVQLQWPLAGKLPPAKVYKEEFASYLCPCVYAGLCLKINTGSAYEHVKKWKGHVLVLNHVESTKSVWLECQYALWLILSAPRSGH